MVRSLLIASALAATATIALPSNAFADDRDWRHGGYYDDDDDDDDDRGRRYYRNRSYYNGYAPDNYYYGYSRGRYRCRSKGTTGLIVGGAAGALLGSQIARDRTTGAIIGGAAGALLGRQVTRRNRC